MNEKPHPPKMLFIVPDKDILSILHNIGVSDALTIGAVIHYLVKQIDMIIERRRMDLLDKKPGSVCQDDQPKIVWVRMLKRPAVVRLDSSNIYALRGKFNSILEEHIQDGNADNHYIISIEVDNDNFDLTGNLTTAGQLKFWNEILRGLEKFDTGAIKLKPRKYQPIAPPDRFIKSVVLQHNKRKLPTPPMDNSKRSKQPHNVVSKHRHRSKSSERGERKHDSDNNARHSRIHDHDRYQRDSHWRI